MKELPFYLLLTLFSLPSTATDVQSGMNEFDICEASFGNGLESGYSDTFLDMLNLHIADAIQFLITGPMAFAFCVMLILIFSRYPKSRQKPGDVMLAMTISEIVLAVLFTISGATYFLRGRSPQVSRSNLCLGTSVVNLFFSLSHYLYNYSFCLYLFYMVRNVLKQKEASTLSFHLVCFLGPAFFLIIMAIFENFGKNIYGTCSINALSLMFFWRPMIIGVYMLLALLTVIYFKYNVNKNQGSHGSKKKYLNYYYSYVKITIAVWGILGICDILVLSGCRSMRSELIRFFLILGNLSDSASPLLLSFFRLNDPFINKRFHRIRRALILKFCACFLRDSKIKVNRKGLKYVLSGKNEKPEAPLEIQEAAIEMRKTQEIKAEVLELPPTDVKKGTPENALIKDEPNLTEVQSQSSIESNTHWIQNIRGQMKVNLIHCIISGVLIDHLATKPEDQENSEENKELLSKDTFQKEKVYDIDDNNVMVLMGAENLNKEKIGKDLYKNKLFSSAYKAFAVLRSQRSKFINYQDSLDIRKNEKQIAKAGGAQGGRGGQFFLFTHDCRLIIKTLTKEEYLEMIRMSGDYFTYLQENSHSLIAPILGVYKMKRHNFAQKQKYYFVLMRNLAVFPRESIDRIYDMKGSSDDREVLKKEGNKDPKNLTLKDTDFKNLEKKIHIPQDDAKKLISVLAQDSLFFASKGFMDYSLIVIKINKDRLTPEEAQFSDSLQEGDCFFYPSIKESNTVYHLGLIDYLQKWNMKKIAEKYAKQYLLKKKDPSSQDPKIYMERFIKFIEEIF